MNTIKIIEKLAVWSKSFVEYSRKIAIFNFPRQEFVSEVSTFIFSNVTFLRDVVYQKLLKSVTFHGIAKKIIMGKGRVLRHCTVDVYCKYCTVCFFCLFTVYTCAPVWRNKEKAYKNMYNGTNRILFWLLFPQHDVACYLVWHTKARPTRKLQC